MRWTRQRWACDVIAGRTSVRERSNGARTNGANADGEVVWSWHPLLVSSWRRRSRPDRARTSPNPPTTVTKGIRSPGRARRKPLKPLRAGMPGDSGEPVATTLVCLLHFCTRGCGCSGHPAFPTPSDFHGAGRFQQNSRAHAARSRSYASERCCLKIESVAQATAHFVPCSPFQCKSKWWARLRFAHPTHWLRHSGMRRLAQARNP
jgi:hypothetical protein